MLAGEFKPDNGTIATEKEVKIGFLRQDIDFVKGRTVLEEAYQAFEEIKYYEAKIDQINHQLGTRTDYESIEYGELIEQLSDFQHQYEIHGGYNYIGDTEKNPLRARFQKRRLQ